MAIANSLSLSQIKERVNAVKEKEELQSRFEVTYKEASKSKQLWKDPKKRKKLESLLAQLEKLIESESNSVINKATKEPIFEESDTVSDEQKLLAGRQSRNNLSAHEDECLELISFSFA